MQFGLLFSSHFMSPVFNLLFWGSINIFHLSVVCMTILVYFLVFWKIIWYLNLRRMLWCHLGHKHILFLTSKQHMESQKRAILTFYNSGNGIQMCRKCPLWFPKKDSWSDHRWMVCMMSCKLHCDITLLVLVATYCITCHI